MKETILNVEGLEIQFHTRTGVVNAVNGVSFNLKNGETLAIVGESGCGKSVSVKSILGLIPMPPGEILAGQAIFRGKDLLGISKKELKNIRGNDIAMIFQDPMNSLNPVLTVGEQIAEMIRRHLGYEKKEALDRAVDLLEMVQIPDPKNRINNFPHQLSGGMRQRVMIAMALSCNPKILIADEPTTALDVTIQAQIIDLVKGLRDQLGMSMIWITHDLGVVAGLAERVIVMYSGRIVEEGNVFDIFDSPNHPYTIGLLGSLPKPEDRSDLRLPIIEGSPMEMKSIPNRCFFSQRCKYAVQKCFEAYPPIFRLNNEHKVSCWVDIESRKLR